MDFKNIMGGAGNVLQQVGQVAGAMNPAYQRGVQMAQQEQQRKRMNILMQSPMMQRAFQETFGDAAPFMMGAVGGGMPFEQTKWLGDIFKGDSPNTPFEYWLSRNPGRPVSEYYSANPPAGRTPKTMQELYQDYLMGNLKEQQDPFMDAIIRKYAEDNELDISPKQGPMTWKEFLQYMSGSPPKQMLEPPKDKYGYYVGETTMRNGKTYEYIGNNQWQAK